MKITTKWFQFFLSNTYELETDLFQSYGKGRWFHTPKSSGSRSYQLDARYSQTLLGKSTYLLVVDVKNILAGNVGNWFIDFNGIPPI